MTDNFKLTGQAYIFNMIFNYFLVLLRLLHFIRKYATKNPLEDRKQMLRLFYNIIIVSIYCNRWDKIFNQIYNSQTKNKKYK